MNQILQLGIHSWFTSATCFGLPGHPQGYHLIVKIFKTKTDLYRTREIILKIKHVCRNAVNQSSQKNKLQNEEKGFENWMGYWEVCGIGTDVLNGGFWRQFCRPLL
jgi:hypothetical protein